MTMERAATARARTPPPPLRTQPGTADDFDSERISHYLGMWRAQDVLIAPRDRAIEENIRMLAGEHWLVWHPVLGQYFNVADWMTSDEKRWRQRPVINKLLKWFMLTHARMTENPPILTFLPGPDRIDAELAEVMDLGFKLAWRDAGMGGVWSRAAAWLIASGVVYLGSRLDMTKGPWRERRATVPVPVVQPGGAPLLDPLGQPATVMADNVPLSKDWQPLAVMTPDGLQQTGEPHATREGQIVVDVFPAPAVRGQWGEHREWHDKAWHAVTTFHTPEEVFETWGVEVAPDTGAGDVSTLILEQMLLGSGYFGAAAGKGLHINLREGREGLCRVTQVWERPRQAPGMEESPTAPGGRYIVFTPSAVLRDGPRPVAFPNTSPLRRFDFVQLPGRPGGSTPQEAMNGPQRSYNKARAQVMEHANLVSNPKPLIDQLAGIQDGQWTNEPGVPLKVTIRPGVKPVEWLTPPTLGTDAYKNLELLGNDIEDIGNLKGTQGEPVSPDQSGEAIAQLRFNSDRFIGPTMRRAPEEFGRMADDWRVLMRVIYDAPRLLSLGGEDGIVRTVNAMPYLFEAGHVNVVPDLESMLPEGRGERQARVEREYDKGLYGAPGTPEAINRYFDLARFPHQARSAMVGGMDRVTAEQEHGKLLMGLSALEIPVFEWYDHTIHLMAHERVMKSPEFLKYPPPVQNNFMMHRQFHRDALRAQQALAQAAANAAAMQQQVQGEQQATAQGAATTGRVKSATVMPGGQQTPGAPTPPPIAPAPPPAAPVPMAGAGAPAGTSTPVPAGR